MMNESSLRDLFNATVSSPDPSSRRYDLLAEATVSAHANDPKFREHIKHRFGRVTELTGHILDPENFDLATARAYLADEVGFSSWDDLLTAVDYPESDPFPILFRYAIAALWRGDFTSLERAIGGGEEFSGTIIDWWTKGYFSNEIETLNESFAAACMLGHTEGAEFLLDNGVDPYAGMRTGLAGFHWAASSGRLNIIKMLTSRKVPMEVENMYGGTVLGQALWSARYEHTPHHAEIIEVLISAGAHVWPGTTTWWEEQDVPSSETKKRVAEALARANSSIS